MTYDLFGESLKTFFLVFSCLRMITGNFRSREGNNVDRARTKHGQANQVAHVRLDTNISEIPKNAKHGDL